VHPSAGSRAGYGAFGPLTSGLLVADETGMLQSSFESPRRPGAIVAVLALVVGMVFAGGSSAALGVLGSFEQRSTSVRATGATPASATVPTSALPGSPATTAAVVSLDTDPTAGPPSPATTTPRPSSTRSTTTTPVPGASGQGPQPVGAVGPPPPPPPPACAQATGGWRAPGAGLYELAVDGSGTARRILDDALNAQAISLSPDGRTFSVVSAVPNFNGVDGPFQLYLVDRDGSNLRRILADLDNPFAAQWSPDGRWIAFLNSEPESYTTGLYVTDPTGATVRRLATAYESGASGGNGLVWSPQSDRIAYSTNQAPAAAVRVVRLSDGNVTTIFRGGDVVNLSWSPDGTRLVGTMIPMGVVVMSASSEGGTTIDQRASSARWSPLADEIATGFLVLAPDGAFLREMVLQRALDWSPDGRRVVGYDPWGTMVIVEERCGTALVAADAFRTGYIGWSPDGPTVLVYSR
jgi:hypothetical protein